MKPLNGYQQATTFTQAPKLPAGGYEIKILDTEILTYNWGEVLKLSLDIAAGEHKDFYANNYKAQTAEDKKWKGEIRINIPKEDGTDLDNLTMSKFKTAITAIEESNKGYAWNWDETSLKGKSVGALFQSEPFEFNGMSGYYTKCQQLIDIEKIRSNDYTLPSVKEAKKPQGTQDGNGFMNIPDGIDEELPFN